MDFKILWYNYIMLSAGVKLDDVIIILSRDALFSKESSLPPQVISDFSSEKGCCSAILAGGSFKFSSKSPKKLLGQIRAGRLFLR